MAATQARQFSVATHSTGQLPGNMGAGLVAKQGLRIEDIQKVVQAEPRGTRGVAAGAQSLVQLG